MRLTGMDGFKTVMGYRYIDDIIKEQEKQKVQLENALADATLNSEIIDSISKIYWIIYRMDLVAGTYEEISAGQDVHRLPGKRGIITEVFREVRETVVDDEHQELMKRFLDTSTLVERLQDTDSVAMEYRASSGSWHLGRFIVKKRNEQGQVTNVLYVVCQIDQQKQLELEYKQQLLETAEEARRANMAKTDSLRRMSHDIRTPINGIQGMVAIAEHFSKDSIRQRECIGKIKEASGYLLDLVNSILDMNKLESGTVVLERRPFDLMEVLRETNSITEMNGVARGLQVSLHNDKMKHTHLIGSPVHLKQILQNISGNAVKYNQEGGSIRLSCEEISCADGKAVYRFGCEDTGRGMRREFVPHAFEPFAQEEISARTSYMGTGLGLAIVKQLVEMMGGTIEVKSEEGKGSEFIVCLSCRVSGRVMRYEPVPQLRGARALVVDDDTNTCMSVSKMLRGIEMRPDWTTSGKEAVIRAQEAYEEKDEFKAFIIDWLMPDMNGIETVRRIRKVIGESVPIIILTAYDWADIEEEAKEAGVTAFVAKPLFMSELRSALTTPILVEEPEKLVGSGQFQGKKVLLVEDNELNLEIASAILQEEGLVVDTARDGVEAVNRMAAAGADDYDLILMDVQMPQMDGYTATREIRTLSDNRKANIPIIAMTANAFEEDKEKAFAAGMDDHIAKPIDIHILLDTLNKIFSPCE